MGLILTWYFSFIGDGDDPSFSWNPETQQFSAGNLPPRLAPTEKWKSLGISVREVRAMIEQNGYPGKQLDWGAWGVELTHPQLYHFLNGNADAKAGLKEIPIRKRYILVAAEGG